MKQRAVLLKLHNLSSFESDRKNQENTFDCFFEEEVATTQQQHLSPLVGAVGPLSKNTTSIPITFEAALDDELDCDWAMGESETSATQPVHLIEQPTPTESPAPTLYSFYFEETDSDDSSVSLHDDVILEDADYCLDDIQENPDQFWCSAPMMSQQRRDSVAEVSITSADQQRRF